MFMLFRVTFYELAIAGYASPPRLPHVRTLALPSLRVFDVGFPSRTWDLADDNWIPW